MTDISRYNVLKLNPAGCAVLANDTENYYT